jgi:hypothetical protein
MEQFRSLLRPESEMGVFDRGIELVPLADLFMVLDRSNFGVNRRNAILSGEVTKKGRKKCSMSIFPSLVFILSKSAPRISALSYHIWIWLWEINKHIILWNTPGTCRNPPRPLFQIFTRIHREAFFVTSLIHHKYPHA